MKRLMINDNVTIHCYKHDGSIHRAWSRGIVLDVTDDYCILININILNTNFNNKTATIIITNIINTVNFTCFYYY